MRRKQLLMHQQLRVGFANAGLLHILHAVLDNNPPGCSYVQFKQLL
jgi:hypothetical protein